MNLWNFQAERYDTVTTITDVNARLYMPVNKVLENQYEMLRNQGEQPIQAVSAILGQHQVWN
jgi:hypothetical protein